MSHSSPALPRTDICDLISRNLKALREARGLYQKDLAAIMNMSFRSYQRIENDGNSLRVAQVALLHRGLGYATPGEMVDSLLKPKA